MSSLVSTSQFGSVYDFGFEAADAPVIVGFIARGAETKWGPEVFAEAKDGEGHTDSVTTSLPAKRQIDGSFTGYVNDQFDPSILPAYFTFLDRFFIIKPNGISVPRRKGEYNEITIEATSYANVTAPA